MRALTAGLDRAKLTVPPEIFHLAPARRVLVEEIISGSSSLGDRKMGKVSLSSYTAQGLFGC